MPQIAQRADVPAVYLIGIADRRDRALNAGFAQQVQHRIGGAIGVILDILGLSSRELVARMKAGYLQLALQSQFANRCVADVEKIVVLEEIVERPRMNEQRRFTVQWIRLVQADQFRTQLCQQSGSGSLPADEKAHAIGEVRGLREWAQVEADDGFFQPAARDGDDFVVIDEQLPQLVPIRFRVS
jgi:hypothetical protein